MKNKQFEKLITTRHDREKFRENLIKFSNYERSDTMDIIRNMQKCQRNWDYSREVSKEVIEHFNPKIIVVPNLFHVYLHHTVSIYLHAQLHIHACMYSFQ